MCWLAEPPQSKKREAEAAGNGCGSSRGHGHEESGTRKGSGRGVRVKGADGKVKIGPKGKKRVNTMKTALLKEGVVDE